MNSIAIYTTPTCGFCHMAKEYFKGLNLNYDEHDLTQDAAAQEWVQSATGQMAVPVIKIEDEVIVGFDRNRIDSALRQNKLLK